MDIVKKLFELKEDEYKNFTVKLIPNIPYDSIIGVRIPNIRKLAKNICSYDNFIKNLPHKYHDENILHAIMISDIKNYVECINLLEEFLPYVNNWAVCDIISPKILKNNKEKLLQKINIWKTSNNIYTKRFALKMLMTYFLDEDFNSEYLLLPLEIKDEDYYINMMIAWFYAEALVKQWNSTIIYIQDNKLSKWIHNKTIQKACESRRISDSNKEYLKRYRKK